MKIFVIFGFLINIYSCVFSEKQNPTYKESTKLFINPQDYTKDSIPLSKFKDSSVCNFESFLNDPKVPQLAKRIYLDKKWSLTEIDSIELLDSLDKSEISSKPFYFKVITKSYKNADGFYSEGLGNTGKEFIENKTKEFAAHFDNKTCFPESDLNIWVNIAILEFSIIGDDAKDDSIIVDFNKKIKSNCIDCTSNQKTTIDMFAKKLEIQWQENLKFNEKENH